MLTRLNNDERGVAMVVALMVAFVLLILSTVVVAQSIHSLDSSDLARSRLTAVNAAEAGTNAWYEYLQTTSVDELGCTTIAQSLDSEPTEASFSADVVYYDASGAEMDCPFSSTTYPSAALITSTGSVTTEAARTFQSYVVLTPIAGAGFGSAILANSNATFVNSFDVFGEVGNDGDIYVITGNLNMGNSGHVRGSIFVPTGSATLSGSARVEGTLWTNGSITMSNTASIGGDGFSSTGSISGSNSAAIGGDARAAGTITGVQVGGTTTPNTASGPPPTITFPQVTWVPTDWTGQGYTINTYSGASACTNAKSFLTGAWSGNYVVRITGPTPCTLTFSNNTTVNVGGNIAIVTDWGITFQNRGDWNGSTTTKRAYFISVWGTNCTGTGASSKTVATANNTNFNAFVTPIFYSPCNVSMQNSSNFKGQVIGGGVSIANNFNMTYTEVLVPGIEGAVAGFDQDISYIREVT